jgi:hypothetical protein
VDRDAKEIDFVYPQFFDNPDVGDIVVLGQPPHPDFDRKNTYVRIVAIREVQGWVNPRRLYTYIECEETLK